MATWLIRNAWRPVALVFALLAVWTVPRGATAETIQLSGGLLEIRSDGGDIPTIPDPLLELVFGFPVALGSIEYTTGSAYPTSPVHGTSGGLQLSRSPLPEPLTAGAVIDLSTNLTWTAGSLTDQVIAGCCFDYLTYSMAGTFSIEAGDAILQAEGDQLRGYAPFTFMGLVNAFDATTGAPAFERRLQGQGQVLFITYPTAYWPANNPDRAAYGDFFVYAYEFEPVPEPTTIVLVSGGLGFLAVRARRRAPR